MAWKSSVSGEDNKDADAFGKQLKTERSIRKISESPAYRLYRMSYDTGQYALKWADIIAKGFENLWRLTLSDAFGRMISFARNLTELKRSRFIRGEFSIMRGVLILSRNTAKAFELIFRSFFSRGPVYGYKVASKLFRNAVSNFWTKNNRLFNYLAPIAGMAVLGLTIYLWSGFTMAVSVSYNNKVLGAVSTEQVYKAAASDVETKVTEASGTGFTLSMAPVYKLELCRKSDLLNQDELYDNILSASSNDVSNSYGLYVENNLVGANDDSASIQTMLDSILSSYKQDATNEQVGFYQDVEIKKGVFPKSVERSAGDMKAILTASAKDLKTYTAQKGDSAAMVANLLHVSVEQIYAMNASVETNGITQGETIQVVNQQPTLLVKYTKREVSTQSISYQTVSTQSDKKAKGITTITQDGRTGVMQLVSDVTYVGDTVIDSNTISTTMLKAPVNQYQIVGTNDLSGKSSSIIDLAERYLGGRYSYGGSSPGGFDCSGFTMYVFNKYGISLPHSAAGQSGYGSRVSRGSLRNGDLVFFDTTGGISHVGIYIGNGQFINAENYRSGVTIDSLNTAYWSRTFVTARRVLQ
jgi:cell wall-associated NlpC family hydrolase